MSALPHLQNGRISYSKSAVFGKYPVQTIATFTCNNLYRREGHSFTVCHASGNWISGTTSCNLSNEYHSD